MIEPATALLITRLVFNVAALLLWGGSACLLLINDQTLRELLWHRLRPWGVGAAGLAGFATLAGLPVLTASLGSGWGNALESHMLTLVATRTLVGSVWGWQLAAMVVMGAVLIVPALRRPAGVSVASALMLATLTVSGHTAMHDGAVGVLHRLNDWGHLLAGGFWLGALVPVVLLLGQLKQPAMRQGAIQALIRFSSVGHLAVALAVLTGMVNTWLVVGGLPLDGDVVYQCALWLKVALVGLLVAMAMFNRYCLVPRLAREAGALQRLRRVSMAEIAILIGVVALVGWFGTLPPGHG
ncbi:copper homeostasis membrane protein CopD [Kushneria indalinina]|uniref:Copper resistance protein D n=1 Tax=Kushneria indalinina DSM 14324 TaxID=1122140 RepID=A0A3D9DVA3_9GAMM|nr:copper homeostasis membrane protein CopD [Kushneria indalinina]REC94713.1 putative copper resistance protein D [Kushneria indalinina DSM 14324]